jgi:hypothetical protein
MRASKLSALLVLSKAYLVYYDAHSLGGGKPPPNAISLYLKPDAVLPQTWGTSLFPHTPLMFLAMLKLYPLPADNYQKHVVRINNH